MVEGLIEEAVVGKTYTGPVKRIMDFGAFVEILPGKEGLVHISKLAATRVENVSDVVKEGQVLTVTVTEIDHMGRINLATKEALDANPGAHDRARRAAAPRAVTGTGPAAAATGTVPAADRRPAGTPTGRRARPAAGRVRRGETGDLNGKTGERGDTAPRASRPHRHPLHRVLVSPRLPGRGPRRRGASRTSWSTCSSREPRGGSALSIAQEIDRVGGIINAFTEKETTCVYAIIPREHLRLAFDILTDMTSAHSWTRRSWRRKRRSSSTRSAPWTIPPRRRATTATCARCGASTPWRGRSPARWRRSQGSGARATWCASPGEWLVPGQYVIAVAGQLRRRTRRGSSPPPSSPPAARAHARGRRGQRPPGSGRPRSCRTGSTRSRSTRAPATRSITRSPHYYTSLVFSTAFGESMSCRLFQKLREELGLCYTVYSFRTFFSDTGMWTIYANTTPAQTPKFPGGAGQGAGPAPGGAAVARRRSRTRRATWSAA